MKPPRHGFAKTHSHRKTVLLYNEACKRPTRRRLRQSIKKTDTSTTDNTCAVLPTSHRLQSMVISTTTGKWSDNEVNPTNAPTSERFSQTRLILAALQAHHNKNSEFVQNSDAKLPTSNSTMIIICTMSTPLSSIRFFLSAQVLLSQERSCRPRLHCCKQKLTFHWSNNHAMASRGHAATEKLYYYSTRHAKG